MSDLSAEKVVAEWTAAMEGVPAGPWKWYRTGRVGPLSLDEPDGSAVLIAEEYAGSCWIDIGLPAEAWLARCSPSGIRSLLDLIAQQAARLEEKDALIERLRLEAQTHAGEARCHKSTVHEAYQACTGATGEPGNWHGAEPIKTALASAKAALTAAEAEVGRLRDEVDHQRAGKEKVHALLDESIRQTSRANERIIGCMAALKPFAHYAETLDDCYSTPHGGELRIAGPITSPFATTTEACITLADLRSARACLSSKKEG